MVSTCVYMDTHTFGTPADVGPVHFSHVGKPLKHFPGPAMQLCAFYSCLQEDTGEQQVFKDLLMHKEPLTQKSRGP